MSMLLPKLELLNRLITQKSLRSFASRRSNCTATAMTRTRARTMKFGSMGTAIKPKRTDKVMLRIISEKNICIRNLSFVIVVKSLLDMGRNASFSANVTFYKCQNPILFSKSVGIWTRGHMMVGTDGYSGLGMVTPTPLFIFNLWWCAISALFSFFGLFKNHYNFTIYNCKNGPSSIHCRDLN